MWLTRWETARLFVPNTLRADAVTVNEVSGAAQRGALYVFSI